MYSVQSLVCTAQASGCARSARGRHSEGRCVEKRPLSEEVYAILCLYSNHTTAMCSAPRRSTPGVRPAGTASRGGGRGPGGVRNRREIMVRLRAFPGMVAASLCLWMGAAHAMTLHVTDDTFIQKESPNDRSGSAGLLSVDNRNLNRGHITYALFDLSLLPPNAVIDRAVLRFFVHNVSQAGTLQWQPVPCPPAAVAAWACRACDPCGLDTAWPAAVPSPGRATRASLRNRTV
jgi:hypothetical protein